MLFNSFEFLVFFPLVTALYFLLPHRFRWALLLAASCAFYMAFVPYYILILAGTIVVDYLAGILIEDRPASSRRWLLIASVVTTCAILFVFKYFNFANANLAGLAEAIHWNYPIKALSLILPIGLSFHTFQSLSYVIEVYRGNQKAERNFGIYSLYVMFYPQLVAGPIERPQNLLHQFRERHDFEWDRVLDGLRLMLWGMFKKIVIADRLAVAVNQVYNHPTEYTGSALAIATVFFAVQIYCDFSGYSEIAIGAARVMGFDLMKNFDSPYHSRSISEFWRRWHISLSTWFKDYVYVPLGGNRVGPIRWQANLFVTFLLSGLWHGAAWTYVVWGALNGFYLVFSIWTLALREHLAALLHLAAVPRLRALWQVAATFGLTCVAWIFFRANSVGDAWYILTHIPYLTAKTPAMVLSPNDVLGMGMDLVDIGIALCSILALEVIHRLQRGPGLWTRLLPMPTWVRWGGCYGLILWVLLFGVYDASDFIYFQF